MNTRFRAKALQPVTNAEQGMTLRDFLAARLGITKRQAKDMLNSRNVVVNGRRVWMACHRLFVRDQVALQYRSVQRTESPPFQTLYEDNDLIVVNKRPGWLSNGFNSVESYLRDQTGNSAIQAVHRLDRDTSGCLILAKNERAAEAMTELFRRKMVHKTYHALAIGKVEPAELVISIAIDGAEARTKIRALDSNRRATHLIATPETGRTHQIRKHLQHIGHPVVGDRQYGVSRRISGQELAVGRQMLHASTVEFPHPLTGRQIAVKAPLPRDFRSALIAFSLT